MTPPPPVLGWDIGGVNTKVARLESGPNGPELRTACLPYEIKRDPSALIDTLVQAARSVGGKSGDQHAVTMTAELSQAFRTKREGIGFVLNALQAALPGGPLHVYSVENTFLAPQQARELPLAIGAANWAATAWLVARSMPTCVLIDMGTTLGGGRFHQLKFAWLVVT